MKTLIFLILLVFSINAQQYDAWFQSDTLIGGTDTLVVDTLKSWANKIYLSATDTGTTNTDSIIVEAWDTKLQLWIPLSVGNLSDMTEYSYAVPGAGNTRMFEILFGGGSKYFIIRQRLVNVNGGFVNGRRVLTSLRIVNNW